MDASTRTTLLARLHDPQDLSAWNEFEARYSQLILRVCRRHGLSRPESEDVCQWVFLGFLHALASFQYQHERGRFRGYLKRATGHAIQRHREQGARLALPLDPHALESLIADQSVA